MIFLFHKVSLQISSILQLDMYLCMHLVCVHAGVWWICHLDFQYLFWDMEE
jgi:hypothetical protein